MRANHQVCFGTAVAGRGASLFTLCLLPSWYSVLQPELANDLEFFRSLYLSPLSPSLLHPCPLSRAFEYSAFDTRATFFLHTQLYLVLRVCDRLIIPDKTF